MRRFTLRRTADTSGVSGVGLVAQGVEFDDGTVALRWLSAYRSTVIFDSALTMILVHGHDGDTVIEWQDEPLAALIKRRDRERGK